MKSAFLDGFVFADLQISSKIANISSIQHRSLKRRPCSEPLSFNNNFQYLARNQYGYHYWIATCRSTLSTYSMFRTLTNSNYHKASILNLFSQKIFKIISTRWGHVFMNQKKDSTTDSRLFEDSIEDVTTTAYLVNGTCMVRQSSGLLAMT